MNYESPVVLARLLESAIIGRAANGDLKLNKGVVLGFRKCGLRRQAEALNPTRQDLKTRRRPHRNISLLSTN